MPGTAAADLFPATGDGNDDDDDDIPTTTPGWQRARLLSCLKQPRAWPVLGPP